MTLIYYFLVRQPSGRFSIVTSTRPRLIVPIACRPRLFDYSHDGKLVEEVISQLSQPYPDTAIDIKTVTLEPLCYLEAEIARQHSNFADALKVYFATRHEYNVDGTNEILASSRITEVISLVDMITTSEHGAFEARLLRRACASLEEQLKGEPVE